MDYALDRFAGEIQQAIAATGLVPADQIDVLRAWVAEGMPWEDGFTFGPNAWEPPLKPRKVDLPPVIDGRAHPIDRLIDHYLARHQIPRPAPADDATIVRRISMDLVGLLPDPEQVAQFSNDRSPDKREKLIAATLARDVDYTEHWLSFWNDLLRNEDES